MSKVLLITPPFTQLNTPYPATAYLKGYLNTIDVKSFQCDLGIELIDHLFSKRGVYDLFVSTDFCNDWSSNAKRIFKLKDDYTDVVDLVMSYLRFPKIEQAYTICETEFLPKASRFDQLADLDWSFGNMGVMDKAKYLCTLFLEDLADFISEVIDPHFGFSKYAERLARSASSFDNLDKALSMPLSFIDNALISILENRINEINPGIVAITIPFPGNVYGALRIGQWIKENKPEVKITIGGGYVNTELRALKDTRIFRYLDFITLDDGELPLKSLINYLDESNNKNHLKRTFIALNGEVKYVDDAEEKEVNQEEVGVPDYSDLELDKYLSVLEIANPMFRHWSDGKWLKLTLAHGCYWAKCTFCDGSLDYIGRYEPSKVKAIVDKMEAMMAQMGLNGFHFVDEAAPPALLREVALEIIKRKLKLIWWTNIRFEKNFTYDLCRLLKKSGCIAVSGGLEVASDRILKLINKGVDLAQVTQVASNFKEAGIMIHAYLMYGFPTQTEQETIDSLEVVRQLFEMELLTSAFWHQFAMTAHSDVGLNPEKYNVQITGGLNGTFANNDLQHSDPSGAHHELYGAGLKKALYNYMHGICFEFRLEEWFDFKVTPTSLPTHYLQSFLKGDVVNRKSRVVWLEQIPEFRYFDKKKQKKTVAMCEVSIYTKSETIRLSVKEALGKWFETVMPKLTVNENLLVSLEELEKSFVDNQLGNFEIFLSSYTFKQLQKNSLVLI